ncbi:hypothetical protein J6590_096190 [Homalodisca vitripennis]|nr:hypothetical protein J6590_096190 [Homalodisca vitripennis]
MRPQAPSASACRRVACYDSFRTAKSVGSVENTPSLPPVRSPPGAVLLPVNPPLDLSPRERPLPVSSTSSWEGVACQIHPWHRVGRLLDLGVHDVREAPRIQKLYRTAPKRATREVLEASSPTCSIHEEAILAYFTSSYSAKVGCAVERPPGCAIPTAASPPPLLDRIKPREVAKMLRRNANTALGPDSVKYCRNERLSYVGRL